MASGLVEVVACLLARLFAQPVGLALDRVEDRADPARDLGGYTGVGETEILAALRRAGGLV